MGQQRQVDGLGVVLVRRDLVAVRQRDGDVRVESAVSSGRLAPVATASGIFSLLRPNQQSEPHQSVADILRCKLGIASSQACLFTLCGPYVFGG